MTGTDARAPWQTHTTNASLCERCRDERGKNKEKTTRDSSRHHDRPLLLYDDGPRAAPSATPP